MAQAFWWRNRQVEIQTRYHENGACVSAWVDGQEIGCYRHFEQALEAIRAVVLLDAPLPQAVPPCPCRTAPTCDASDPLKNFKPDKR